MPHVEIFCYPGRSDEQKTGCAEKVAEAVAQTLGCDTSSVSVTVKEIRKEDWKEKIWDAKIIPDDSEMYKKPGYDMN